MILTTALVSDNSGSIKVVWFNQPYLIKVLKRGDEVALAGKILFGKEGIYLSGPTYEKMGDDFESERSLKFTHVGRIIPVYPETEGLSSRWLRFIIKPILLVLQNQIVDLLPVEIRRKYNFPAISPALWQIHFPDSLELAKKAKDRFSFEELFFIALFTLRARLKLLSHIAPAAPINVGLLQKFVKSLPFKLTDAQKKSAWQILKDTEKNRPMNRLLEGDVGSGKTVVAALDILNIVKAGYQVGFMAPTEILAKQHFQTLAKLLKDFKISIALLTGKEDKIMSKKLKNEVIEISRKKLLEKTRDGQIDVIIGTHALIQDRVKFGKLGLVIVDEQHRFGVEQRARLTQQSAQKNSQPKPVIPHLLSLTATPIPRTLALTIYGDLDLSLIDEMPKGRKKIITKIIAPKERETTYEFIRKEVKAGRQVFVICPRIEKMQNTEYKTQSSYKDVLTLAEAKTVEEEYEKLSKTVFPDLHIGMLHGRMSPKEKEKIMRDFKNRKIDILVSTSVVEVGIDIPNATVMMIEGAERFGLAQLHQFRGRVGRGEFPASDTGVLLFP